PPDVERRGVGDGAAEELREFERQLDRAVASHGKAPDHPPLTLRDRLEGVVYEADHIFEEVALVSWAFDRIAVKAAAAVRHHDDQWQAGNVALDARAARPGRVVIRKAVEEIADRKRRLPDTALGEDHVHRACLQERRTVEVQGRECHGRDSSCIRGWSKHQYATPGMASTFCLIYSATLQR